VLEIADRLLAAARAGTPLAVVTVTGVTGSAPREVGASMALAGGAVLGSISGGCVESAAVEACERVLERGRAEVDRFGFSDEDALAVGLSCGGELDVLVHIPDSEYVRAELEEAMAGRAAGLGTVIAGPAGLLGLGVGWGAGRGRRGELTEGDLLAAGLSALPLDRVRSAVDAQAATGAGAVVELDCGDGILRLFVESTLPAPRLLLFGAVEFAAALAEAGRALGYRVTVCDARSAFTTAARFPVAHEVIVEWPHLYLSDTEVDSRTVICVLSHDDRFDLPLLRQALELPAAYVGALGSRRTAERRRAALRESGMAEETLARLHSPMGLDVGASTPAETAVSVLAEVLAVRRAGSGLPLRDLDGPIHRRAGAPVAAD
jgi:xanthine dehydrogenase accessory factor